MFGKHGIISTDIIPAPVRAHCFNKGGLQYNLCGYGGIGRRAGFRFQWETVQVQILLSAGKEKL